MRIKAPGMRIKALCAVLLALTSCGPGPVLTADGPTRTDGADPSQFRRFQELYALAIRSDAVAAPGANAALLRAGLGLIANNCTDFFRREGRTQQRLAFFRDTTAALAPLAAGALGAARVAGNAVAVVSLSSAGAAAAVNIVARDFLFGADNIDDVRTLVSNALAAHADKVAALQQDDPDSANFDWTVQQLEDNQAICESPRILALAKSAIARGNVVAYTTASSAGAGPGPAFALGARRGLPARADVRIQN